MHTHPLDLAMLRWTPARRPRTVFTAVANPWGLSPAQCAVMAAMLEHYTQREAAAALEMSHRTLETHVHTIRSAMKAVNTLQAVLMWDRHWRKGAE